MESQNPKEKLQGTTEGNAGEAEQPRLPRPTLLDPLGLFDVLQRDVERLGNVLRRSPRPRAEEVQETPGEAGNPVEAASPTVPPEFDSDLAGHLERKGQQWLAEGVRPNLVRMGLDQAVSGAQGMARRMEMFAREVNKPAVMQDYIDNVADAWVRAMSDIEEERRGEPL